MLNKRTATFGTRACISHFLAIIIYIQLVLDEGSSKKERVCDTCLDEMSVEKQRIIAALKVKLNKTHRLSFLLFNE